MTETEQRRALPSNQDFCNKLDHFVKLRQERRNDISKQVRQYIVEPVATYGTDQKFPRYSWDRTAEIWRNILIETKIKDPKTTWFSPKPNIRKPDLTPPKNNMNNSEFIRWVIGDIWNKPEMAYTFFAGRWIQGLNCGFLQEGPRNIKIDRNIVMKHFLNLVEEENKLEMARITQNKICDQNQVNVITI